MDGGSGSSEGDVLGHVASETGIAFLGGIAGKGLLYLLQLLLARWLGPAAYGLYSLGVMTLTAAVLVAGLGLYVGAMRHVAIHNTDVRLGRLKETVLDASTILALTSVIAGFLLFFNAEWLSQLFSKPALAPVLRLLAFALPFAAFSRLLASIANGLGKMKYRVVIEDLILPVSMISLALLLSLRGLKLLDATSAYLIASVLTALVGVIFLARVLPGQGNASGQEGAGVRRNRLRLRHAGDRLAAEQDLPLA